MPNMGVTFDQLNMAAQQGRDYTDKVVTAETTRATGVEDSIKTALGEETTRAKGIEKELLGKVTTETERSIKSETTLEAKLDDEIRRATNAEHLMSSGFTGEIGDVKDGIVDLNGKIADENIRAIGVEDDLAGKIKNEIERSTEADGLVQQQVADEISRATTVESGLGARITDEANRAKDVESGLVQSISDERDARIVEDAGLQRSISSEVSRATEVEDGLQKQVSDLALEATKHVGLQSAINDETTRATTAEKNLRDGLKSEISRAQGVEEGIAENVSTSVTALNAEDVRIAGLIDSETTRATGVEKGLDEKIRAESIRAASAEDAMNATLEEFKSSTKTQFELVDSNLNAEVTRVKTVAENLGNKLASEINRASSAENAIKATVTQEVDRATDAEGNLGDRIDIEKSRAVAAEEAITSAYTEADRIESETRSSQFAALHKNIVDQGNRITSEVAIITEKTDETNAQVNRNINAIKALTDGSVSKIRMNGAEAKNPFNLVFMNGADVVLESLKIAYDPKDSTYGEKSLINKRYADEIATTGAKAINGEISRAKAAETDLGGKITDEIARAKDAEDSITTATKASISTLGFKIDEEATRATTAEDALKKIVDNDLVTKKTFSEDVVTAIKFLQGMGILSTEIDCINPTTLTASKYGLDIISSDDTVKATLDKSDPKNIKLDLSVPVAGDMTTALNGKIEKSVAGTDGTLVTDITHTMKKNPVANGTVAEPEYGQTISIVKKITDVKTGKITETPLDLNMFRISGAWDVQNELYDEITRAKLAEDKITSELNAATTREYNHVLTEKSAQFFFANPSKAAYPMLQAYIKKGINWESLFVTFQIPVNLPAVDKTQILVQLHQDYPAGTEIKIIVR